MNEKISFEVNTETIRTIIREEVKSYLNLMELKDRTSNSLDTKKLLIQHGFDIIGPSLVEIDGKEYLPQELLTRQEALKYLSISNGTFAKLKNKYKIEPVVDGYKHYYDLNGLKILRKKLKII